MISLLISPWASPLAPAFASSFWALWKASDAFALNKKNPFSSVSSCSFFIQLFNHLSKHPLSTHHIEHPLSTHHVASSGNTKTCKHNPCDGGGALPTEETDKYTELSDHSQIGALREAGLQCSAGIQWRNRGLAEKVARADLGEPLLIILCPPRKQPQGGKRRAT